MSAWKKELILALQKFYVALKKVAWILHRRNNLWWRLIKNDTQYPRKVLHKGFHANGYTLGFHHRLKHYSHRTQHNDKYHRKVLLSSFHLKGHTPRFQSQNILRSIIIRATGECYWALSFHWEDSSTDFRLNDAKINVFFSWQ